MKNRLSKLTYFIALLFFAQACSKQINQGNAKDGYNLTLNLDEGKSYPLSMKMDMTITQENTQMPGNVEMQLNGGFEYTVTSKQDDLYDMAVRYTGLDMDMSMMGQKMNFSSTKEDDADMVSKLLGLMTKESFSLVMDSKGKVKEIKDLEAYFERVMSGLSDMNPIQREQIKEQVEQSFGENGLRGNLEQMMGFFPEKAIKIGDSWESTMEMSASAVFKATTKYILKEITETDYIIDFETVLESGQTETVPGVLTELDGTMDGNMKVNRNTGWISKATMNQNIEGKTSMPNPEISDSTLIIPMKIQGTMVIE